MDKIWYAERIKECKSVKLEIVRLLKEEFKISDKDFDCIMYDIESQYHSTPDTLLRMAILDRCAKRGYDYKECDHLVQDVKDNIITNGFTLIDTLPLKILQELVDIDTMIEIIQLLSMIMTKELWYLRNLMM